jgi:hypothetical protein
MRKMIFANTPYENLLGPATDGSMYYLGPLSLLDSESARALKPLTLVVIPTHDTKNTI